MTETDTHAATSEVSRIWNIRRIVIRVSRTDFSCHAVCETWISDLATQIFLHICPCLLSIASRLLHNTSSLQKKVLLDSHLSRCDAMQFIIFHLLGTAAVGFIYGLLHRIGNRVSIHDHKSVDISSCTAGCLRESTAAAEEALLVCIKNCNQRHGRNIKSLTKKVDTHQNIE